MPEWISPDWHDSIVGCMKCQAACPHNAKLIDLVDERICFDEKETGLILDGSVFDNLPIETKEKISYAGMESYYNVLPRNIKLLIDKE
jgi:epoxyqueuosine reductase